MLPDLACVAAYRIASAVVYACVLLRTNSTVDDSPGPTDQSPLFGEYDSRSLRGNGISTGPVACYIYPLTAAVCHTASTAFHRMDYASQALIGTMLHGTRRYAAAHQLAGRS